jgi:hypothetical protein
MYQRRQRIDRKDKYASMMRKGLDSLGSPKLNFYVFFKAAKYKYYYAHYIEDYLKIAAFLAMDIAEVGI